MITSTRRHGEGPLPVDEDLLDPADLVTCGEIRVVNVTLGARFSTCV